MLCDPTGGLLPGVIIIGVESQIDGARGSRRVTDESARYLNKFPSSGVGQFCEEVFSLLKRACASSLEWKV
jgi:hypothetical protein